MSSTVRHEKTTPCSKEIGSYFFILRIKKLT